jgi:uncharacterized protein (TIGR03084 family)
MLIAGPIVDDLEAESDELDALVAKLAVNDWSTPTPAPGWTIAHQIGHLLWTDCLTLLSITDESAFNGVVSRTADNPTKFVDAGAEHQAGRRPNELLADWRRTRASLQHTLRLAAPEQLFPWVTHPMTAAAVATARLMETWAHGLDVADALGVRRPITGRIRSIAHLGVRTRDYAFEVNGLKAPKEAFRVELQAPDQSRWVWGPPQAAQRVSGSAADFCYLVTQRRPLATLDVVATGDDARRWLGIAQAFSGPPGIRR